VGTIKPCPPYDIFRRKHAVRPLKIDTLDRF
jgi:hypothetical protein